MLHQRIRGERERRYLEPALERPLVQDLNVLWHELELEAARVDRAGRQRPDHEGVVRIGGMSESNLHVCTLDPEDMSEGQSLRHVRIGVAERA
jgi:hypothetical protein